MIMITDTVQSNQCNVQSFYDYCTENLSPFTLSKCH